MVDLLLSQAPWGLVGPEHVVVRSGIHEVAAPASEGGD